MGSSSVRARPAGRHDPDILGPRDRLDFEHLLQWLRLSLLLTSLLVLAAFGAAGVTYALVIAAAVSVSFAWVGLLARFRPGLLLRWQLALRILDCGVVYVVLVNYHAFLHNAYYDTVYLLFVVAAAATHGRPGAWLLSGVAGAAVLLGRAQLMGTGSMPYEVRHLTDSVFYTLFFLITASAVAFLMRKSAEVVLRRERTWTAELSAQNAQLEKTAAELAQSVQLRDAMVTGITHDLRTPLTVIKVQAQVLRRRADPADERLSRSLDHIERAATRIGRWIDELLDVARSQRAEDLELNRQPTDLVRLLHEIVADQRANTTHHTLELECDAPSIVGSWDAGRLARVFDNLVGNAIKYSPSGGSVHLLVSVDGGWATVQVCDQGVGIPEVDLPNIFEPFRRGSNVVGRISGTGIGLANVSHVVARHGGTIDVVSREGQGTCFCVRLPR